MPNREEELWYEFSGHGHCGLCGNTGIVDTIGKAVTPAGVHVGVRAYCICPNGRTLKSSMSSKYSGVIKWVYQCIGDYTGLEMKPLSERFSYDNRTDVVTHLSLSSTRGPHSRE